MAKVTPLFTIELNSDTGASYVELTEAGQVVAVKMANIFKASFPKPEYVCANENAVFGKVINFRSPNTMKRFKDAFNQETLAGKTLASAIAGATVELLSMAPISVDQDPLAGF